MKTNTLIALIFVFSFLLGCTSTSENEKLLSHESEGVTLHCSIGRTTDKGWLENLNEYPVRIRRVQRGVGEQTISVNLLVPDRKLEIAYFSRHNGFYIYTIDGVMVGFLSGSCK